MHCGVDIQNIQEFSGQVNSVGPAFLDQIFHPEEIEGLPLDSVVARFCLKEALIKAGVIGIDEWKRVKILTKNRGYKPELSSADPTLTLPSELDFSLSHSGDYAMALVVV